MRNAWVFNIFSDFINLESKGQIYRSIIFFKHDSTLSCTSVTPGTQTLAKSLGMSRFTLALLAASTRIFWSRIACEFTVMITISDPENSWSSFSGPSVCQSEARISIPRALRVVTCGLESDEDLTEVATLCNLIVIVHFRKTMDQLTYRFVFANAWITLDPTLPVPPMTSTRGLKVGDIFYTVARRCSNCWMNKPAACYIPSESACSRRLTWPSLSVINTGATRSGARSGSTDSLFGFICLDCGSRSHHAIAKLGS